MNKRTLFCRLKKNLVSGICFLLALRTNPTLPFFKLSQHRSVTVMLDHTRTNIDCSRTIQGSSCCKYFDHFASPQHIHCFYEGFRKSQINSFNQRNMGERVNHGYIRVGENRNLAPGMGRLVRSYHAAHLFINIMIAQEKLCIFKPLVFIFIVLSAIYIWLAQLWI